jgi:hypothetical protein
MIIVTIFLIFINYLQLSLQKEKICQDIPLHRIDIIDNYYD